MIYFGYVVVISRIPRCFRRSRLAASFRFVLLAVSLFFFVRSFVGWLVLWCDCRLELRTSIPSFPSEDFVVALKEKREARVRDTFFLFFCSRFWVLDEPREMRWADLTGLEQKLKKREV